MQRSVNTNHSQNFITLLIAIASYIYTSHNTMYCGGEPEHHIHNVTSRIF